MKEFLERFLERPTGQKLGIFGAIIVLLAGLFWQFLYSPLSTEREELGSKVDGLRSKVIQETRIANDLPRFRAAVRDLEEKFKIALRELPEKREIPELLQSISGLARDAGLEVTLFQPKPEVPKDFYAEVPVAINVEGTYHQLLTFFDEVGHLTRVVNLSEIASWQPFFRDTGMIKELADYVTGAMPIRASATATTFRYLDESERVEAQSKEDDDKKRRRRK